MVCTEDTYIYCSLWVNFSLVSIFRVNCFRLKHFFKWVTVTEIPEPYSFHDNKKKSWISNNETKTERRVDPELQTLTRECMTGPLYKNMAVNCVFQVLPLLRYGNVGESWFNRNRASSVHQRLVKPVNQGTSRVYLARVSERVFFFVCWFVFHVISLRQNWIFGAISLIYTTEKSGFGPLKKRSRPIFFNRLHGYQSG